jgi:hypothetical protein
MAKILPQTLVLRGARVIDAAAGVVRNGYPQALATRTPTVDLSFPRHLSPSDPMSTSDPGTREERANANGAGHPAPRAGRLGSSAGVLGSRGAAISAARAILFGWPLTLGTTTTACARLLGRFGPRKARPTAEPAVRSPYPLRSYPHAAECWQRRHSGGREQRKEVRTCVASAIG